MVRSSEKGIDRTRTEVIYLKLLEDRLIEKFSSQLFSVFADMVIWLTVRTACITALDIFYHNHISHTINTEKHAV